MQLHQKQLSAGLQGRHLYVVPDRHLARASHVPAGRSLHLIDIENLIGGSDAPTSVLWAVADFYRHNTPINTGDHVIVGSGLQIAMDAGRAFGTRLVIGHGIDGADHALLAEVTDLDAVATMYDRVIVGSGDGIFTDMLAGLRERGIATGVVAQAGGFSWALQRQADFLRIVPSHCYSARIA
jgi:hypothetical protein